MNEERIEELAAWFAAGALEGAELAEWQKLLADADPGAIRECARFQDIAARMAICLAVPVEPPIELKEKILRQISLSVKVEGPAAKSGAALDLAGMKYIFHSDPEGWIPLRVPGASVKLLSLDAARGYAVVLGKLEAGASYPPHKHINTEQVFVISGDLHIGQQCLGAGDFHQADGGTSHDINYSDTGCTILAVISTADLEAQMV